MTAACNILIELSEICLPTPVIIAYAMLGTSSLLVSVPDIDFHTNAKSIVPHPLLFSCTHVTVDDVTRTDVVTTGYFTSFLVVM